MSWFNLDMLFVLIQGYCLYILLVNSKDHTGQMKDRVITLNLCGIQFTLIFPVFEALYLVFLP